MVTSPCRPFVQSWIRVARAFGQSCRRKFVRRGIGQALQLADEPALACRSHWKRARVRGPFLLRGESRNGDGNAWTKLQQTCTCVVFTGLWLEWGGVPSSAALLSLGASVLECSVRRTTAIANGSLCHKCNTLSTYIARFRRTPSLHVTVRAVILGDLGEFAKI